MNAIYLEGLNPEQREATLSTEGPLLVLAGAGSGKTRVITARIATLIGQGVAAKQILALTFTNKAAGEMRDRVARWVDQTRSLWVGTFHSTCARLLRLYGEHIGLKPGFVIYDDDDSRSLIKGILEDLKLPERLFPPKEIANQVDRAKNDGILAADYQPHDFRTDAIAKVYTAYQKRLAQANAVDFGDLILRVVTLLRQNEMLRRELNQYFRYLLVDEFQDTNKVQYDLIRLLSQSHQNLCVVGDDDQSIYSWRGANIANILNFEKDHPQAKVIKLERNYRSTQVILDAAHAIISRNHGRKAKKLWTERTGGELIQYNQYLSQREESAAVAQEILRLKQLGNFSLRDVAIFYRTHFQSRAIEEALRSARTPITYIIVGGVRFYDRAEIKDLLAYLKLLLNPADELALLRVINRPTRGIGATTIERLQTYAKENNLSLFDAALTLSKSANDILSNATQNKLRQFTDLIAKLQSFAQANSQSPYKIADNVLLETGYSQQLIDESSLDAETRLENLQELLVSLREYEQTWIATENEAAPSLAGFLEHVALTTGADQKTPDSDYVTLMTVHGAKGLEFPIVFITGLEQGIFPHSRSLDNDSNDDEMEEERRLAYVAITRAKERLYLSSAETRWQFGQNKANPPSEFIRQIPHALLKVVTQPSFSAARASNQSSRHSYDDFDQSVPDEFYSPAKKRPSATTNKKDPSEDTISVEYFADEADQSYKVGMQVRHKTFGVGKIVSVSGRSPQLNLTVFFPRIGPKTIRSQFVEQVTA